MYFVGFMELVRLMDRGVRFFLLSFYFMELGIDELDESVMEV